MDSAVGYQHPTHFSMCVWEHNLQLLCRRYTLIPSLSVLFRRRFESSMNNKSPVTQVSGLLPLLSMKYPVLRLALFGRRIDGGFLVLLSYLGVVSVLLPEWSCEFYQMCYIWKFHPLEMQCNAQQCKVRSEFFFTNNSVNFYGERQSEVLNCL